MPELTKEEKADFRYLKKAKLYADEDIEDSVVDYLRKKGVNITSARELGHRGKPDSFHYGLSYKDKRFLLTKNTKHYFNDRKFPFHSLFGIISIAGDFGSIDEYVDVIWHILRVVKYGENYHQSKIKISPKEITLRYLMDGKVEQKRYKIEGAFVFEWVDDK